MSCNEKKETMRTWQIRSKVRQTQENADVPMLYKIICNSPPKREKPRAASLKPKLVASLFFDVEEALLELLVVEEDPSKVSVVAVALLQMNLPWMMLPFPPD